jgi:hypothetical protein
MWLYGGERFVGSKRHPSGFRPINAGNNGFPPSPYGSKSSGTNTVRRGTLGQAGVSSREEKESKRQCLYFKF